MARPSLLLLDEPATGLDLAAREQLLGSIDQLRREVVDLASVLVTHHLEDLPISTSHALLLRDGLTVACGDVDDALTTDTISTCFDHPVQVRRDSGRWSARSHP
jgi:iron complex transport system ATP-binding protein